MADTRAGDASRPERFAIADLQGTSPRAVGASSDLDVRKISLSTRGRCIHRPHDTHTRERLRRAGACRDGQGQGRNTRSMLHAHGTPPPYALAEATIYQETQRSR